MSPNAYKAGLVKVTQASRAKGGEVLAGLSEEEVTALMTRFTEEEMVARLHPASAAALAEHQAEGDEVVVVPAALQPLAEALCRWLGVAHYAGALCEIADGRYTGRLLGVRRSRHRPRITSLRRPSCSREPPSGASLRGGT